MVLVTVSILKSKIHVTLEEFNRLHFNRDKCPSTQCIEPLTVVPMIKTSGKNNIGVKTNNIDLHEFITKLNEVKSLNRSMVSNDSRFMLPFVFLPVCRLLPLSPCQSPGMSLNLSVCTSCRCFLNLKLHRRSYIAPLHVTRYD